jgi:ubiquinone/menaquinone biosynthesis C-methylase UbiE
MITDITYGPQYNISELVKEVTMQSFYAQFEYPKGRLGWLVGWLMAIETRERNAWAVSMLRLQPTDRILEIGFGPGSAIAEAAKTAHFVAGIDHSEVMLRQASNFKARAIRQGHVELQLGTADHLPYPSATFDIVFAINSLHIWSDKTAALKEIRRVLKPEGRIAIFEQPFRGDPHEAGQKTFAILSEAGFKRLNVTEKPMKPVATVCVEGLNSAERELDKA